jgi:hypothetical protein
MGFEPTCAGFANRCLTTWLPHPIFSDSLGFLYHEALRVRRFCGGDVSGCVGYRGECGDERKKRSAVAEE